MLGRVNIFVFSKRKKINFRFYSEISSHFPYPFTPLTFLGPTCFSKMRISNMNDAKECFKTRAIVSFIFSSYKIFICQKYCLFFPFKFFVCVNSNFVIRFLTITWPFLIILPVRGATTARSDVIVVTIHIGT